MAQIRTACIGLGPMGLAMSGYFTRFPECEIVAMCDRSESVLSAALDSFEQTTGKRLPGFTSHEELFRSMDFEACAIACSPEVQPSLSVYALEHGKHVLCQVPIAFTEEDCRAIYRAARRSGRVFCCGEETRDWAFFRQWREMERQGSFGKIFYAEGEYLHYEPDWDLFTDAASGTPVRKSEAGCRKDADLVPSWRSRLFSHPILYLPHTLGPLLSVTGGRITRVSCFGTRPSGYVYRDFPFRDLECAVMHNDRDVVFQVKAGFTTPHGFKAGTGAHWYQIKGTKQTVEWARSTLDTPKRFTPVPGTHDGEWQAMDCVLSRPEDDYEIRSSGHGGADLFPVRSFLSEILYGTPSPTGLVPALQMTLPAILAARSSEEGGRDLAVPDLSSFDESYRR